MSSVKLNEYTMVYPAEETPKHSLWLSRLDMMLRQPYSYTRPLFIYNYPNNNSENMSLTNTKSSTFFDVEILKAALSKALVLYYPLAGRLKMNENNNRFEIDCNDKGVLFITAETKCTLKDVDDEFKHSSNKLRKELVPKGDFSKGLSSIPLLIIQVTRFSCGGVTLGLASHHHAADGFAHTQFLNCWATIARGIEPSVLPCHDRATFVGPRVPPQVRFRHLEYEPPLIPIPPKSLSGETPPTVEYYFTLSEKQINALKVRATISSERGVLSNKRVSTFKVIAAHVWRSVCKARGLTDDQDVKLYMQTDGRSRLKDPSLPEGYFGNVVFFSSCVEKAGVLVNNPFCYAVGKIDETVKKLDNSEYLRSAIDYLELQKELSPLVRGYHHSSSPNLYINSWTRLPLSDADFGWGRPRSGGLNEINSEGQCTITSSLAVGKCFNVGIRLYTSHMDLFRKYFDEYLTDE